MFFRANLGNHLKWLQTGHNGTIHCTHYSVEIITTLSIISIEHGGNIKMILDRLATLHQDMLAQSITRIKFVFNFRNLQFSVVYIAENFPHTLLFGCVAHNLFFVLTVGDKYEISTFLGDNYPLLLKALDLRHNPENPFSPKVLFQEFNDRIPQRANANNTPTMTEIAMLSRDVEEPDKVHFCGWRTHDGKTSNVTPNNLHKTFRICGSATHAVCRQHNISSRWTDDASRAIRYYEPMG